MGFLDALSSKLIFFDGGFGTMLQARGLPPGESPVNWNISHSEDITAIHKQYLSAGSDVVSANTFSIFEADDPLPLISAAVENAKTAVDASGKQAFVALDLGSTGKLMSPAGDLTFESAYEIFKPICGRAAREGVDLIIIETMSDLLELKAAAIAALETGLPVITSMTFDENGYTLMGTTPQEFVTTAQALGVCAVGFNCGLGPQYALNIFKKFAEYAQVPIIVQPNAGLPETFDDGVTRYNVGADEFAKYMKEIARSGAGIVGGCCGTTPEYIRAMKAESEGLPAIRITPEARRIICSGSRSVDFDTNIIIKDLEITADIDDIIDQAFELAEDSDIIRLHTPPTGKLLPDIVIALQELIKTPFAFSVRDEKEADAVLRVYNGRPLLDIFPGGQDSRLGPAAGNKFETIANKYGALVYEHNHRD